MSHRITPALLAQLDRVRHDFAKAFRCCAIPAR